MSGRAGRIRAGLRAPLILGLLVAGFTTVAQATWPGDPAVNLAIADGAGEQVLPIPSPTSDGGCYIGWFDTSTGNYNVRLQRLDRLGNEMWPHNGILVSSHAQDTWIVPWDLMTDRDDCAVIAFTDIRDGGDRDVFAYRVSPAGEELWGADGIQLARDFDWDAPVSVTQATDGDLVFAWSHMPDAGARTIQLQRVTPDGSVRFPENGIAAVSSTTEFPGFPDLVPSLDGSVILSWIRDSRQAGLRHFRAGRYNSDGTAAWASFVALFDLSSLSNGYGPTIQTDGAGGIVSAWYASVSNLFTTRFQRVTAAGVEMYAHNGVPAATTSMNHMDCSLAYHVDTHEAYIFWDERDSYQNLTGIYGQKISAGGTRQWTDLGREFLPVDSEGKGLPRAVPFTEGAMVFFTRGTSDLLVGFACDGTGAMIWPGSLIPVSSVVSSKARYPTIVTRDEMAILVWEDQRNGTPDLFAQNVNPDGTLGADLTGVPQQDAGSLSLSLAPNPFSSSTHFAFRLPAGQESARMLILDAAGRVLHGLDLRGRGGIGEADWDGMTASGRLPAGVYFYRVQGMTGARTEGRLVLTQ